MKRTTSVRITHPDGHEEHISVKIEESLLKSKRSRGINLSSVAQKIFDSSTKVTGSSIENHLKLMVAQSVGPSVAQLETAVAQCGCYKFHQIEGATCARCEISHEELHESGIKYCKAPMGYTTDLVAWEEWKKVLAQQPVIEEVERLPNTDTETHDGTCPGTRTGKHVMIGVVCAACTYDETKNVVHCTKRPYPVAGLPTIVMGAYGNPIDNNAFKGPVELMRPKDACAFPAIWKCDSCQHVIMS